MEEDEYVPVAKQVLDSLKTYLCNNLPNDETFIIQLGNAGLISKDKALWLGVLARNKDPSYISNLIKSMRDYFDESMLSNFCTFLDKYAKDARPRMHIVAAKIREKIEFIGKANELKDPGSKHSQPPSDDQQPPSIRPHLTPEALEIKPKEKELRKIAVNCGHQWRALLTNVGVLNGQIQQFQDNAATTQDACFAGLVFWRGGNAEEPATWSVLLEAMEKAHMTADAREWKKKIIDRCSGQSGSGKPGNEQPPTPAEEVPSDVPKLTNTKDFMEHFKYKFLEDVAVSDEMAERLRNDNVIPEHICNKVMKEDTSYDKRSIIWNQVRNQGVYETVEKLCKAMIAAENSPKTIRLGKKMEAALIAKPRKEQDKELPHEDSASNSWKEQYKKAIKVRGSVKVDITRCVLIGPARVGKSSLKQLLVHNEPRPVHESTDLMEAPVVLASMYHQNKGSWTFFTVDNLKQMVKKSTAEGEYDSPSDATVQESHQDSRSTQASGTDHPSELPSFVPTKDDDDSLSDLKSELSRFVTGLESVGDTPLKMNGLKLIHLFDCGGQLPFQDAIPCLIQAPCAFIAVFNASVDLEEVKEWTYCPHEGSEEVGRGHKESQWNILLRIFSSIHSLQCKCHEDLKKLTQDKLSYSWPIAVVGTHKAVLNQHTDYSTISKSISSHFEKLLKSKPYSFLQPEPPDLIENCKTPKDDLCTIVDLRQKISENTSFSLDLPLTWLFLELFTRSHPKLLFIRYEDLRTLCNGDLIRIGDDEFNSLLRVLHALGFYAFYPSKDLGVPEDQNWVCTDAATLYKEVSKLLMVQYIYTAVKRPKTKAAKYLKDFGKIELNDDSLRELFDELKIGKINGEIDRVFSPRWLILVLVCIGLAAKFKPRGGKEQVFIPLALPFKGNDLPPVTELSVATLFLTLEFPSADTSTGSVNRILTDMPCGIFPRLVVLLLSEESKCLFQTSPDSEDYDRACVTLMPSESEGDYRLHLKNCVNWVEVALQVNETAVMEHHEPAKKVYEICKRIRDTLTSSLEDAFLKLFGKQPPEKAVTARCGFKCTCKKSSQNDHLAVYMKPERLAEQQIFKCVLKQRNYRLQSRSGLSLSQTIWFCPVAEAKFSPLQDGSGILVMDELSSSAVLPSASQSHDQHVTGNNQQHKVNKAESAPLVPSSHPYSPGQPYTTHLNDPILNSRPIESDVLLHLSPHLSAQWKEFSIYLRFQPNQRDCIAEDNHCKSDKCFMAVITQWLLTKRGTGDLPRTWGALLQAVCNLGYSGIADEVHKALTAASAGVPLSHPTPPLQPRPLQQQEEQEKEKEGESEEQRPGVAAATEQDKQEKVKFAIITANQNERESAKYLFGTRMPDCKISPYLQKELPKILKDGKAFQTDGISAELAKLEQLSVHRNVGGTPFTYTYFYVKVCGVLGVLTECYRMGSHSSGASRATVDVLLETDQKERHWDLKAVFLVGCCGCARHPEVDLGTVLIADPIISYDPMKVTDNDWEIPDSNIYEIDQDWISLLHKQNEEKKVSRELKVQHLKSASILSGGTLMKNEPRAEALRKNKDIPVLGFEMEGAGAHEAISNSKSSLFSGTNRPALLVVKGVSDFANSDKNTPAATVFFETTREKVDNDSRQQMCTVMSLMVVIRAIKAKWG